MESLPLEITEWPPEIVKKAKEELGETPEVKSEALENLRTLIYEKADFHCQMEDSFLLRFLRVRKYNVEKAFRSIRRYYDFKKRYSGLYTGFTPLDVKKYLELQICFPLPKRHPSGAAIVILTLACMDIDNITADNYLATMLACEEWLLQNEMNQVCGVIVIVDHTGVDLRVMKHYASWSAIYAGSQAFQDCLPLRLKSLHFVHSPPIFSIFYNIMKIFMSKKTHSRTFFHGNDYESLHRHVPKDILPSEFGGTGPSVDHERFRDSLYRRNKYYAEMNKYGFK